MFGVTVCTDIQTYEESCTCIFDGLEIVRIEYTVLALIVIFDVRPNIEHFVYVKQNTLTLTRISEMIIRTTKKTKVTTEVRQRVLHPSLRLLIEFEETKFFYVF